MTFLRCSTDNTASTVLKSFVNAGSFYGIPSRVRSDHGGENTKVALFLNLIRLRTSHITGRSVHNERIARSWRDVHYQVSSVFYEEFYSMEADEEIALDSDNETHRASLQYFYLPCFNKRLDEFRHGWNQHKIRTEHHHSPHQIWLSGMLNHMDSNYTAANEVFGERQSLEETLENGLVKFGLSLNDVEEDLPTADQGLSDTQRAEIDY